MAGARGIAFVVAAPSGAGKTTVCRALVEADPRLVFSVSHTTRPRRAPERQGWDYHFVEREEFLRLVREGAFLEHAEYGGNLYGTTWAAIEAPLARGCDVLLEIEVQGARQVRERLPGARLIFLLPPSLAELEERLRRRATDSEAEIGVRLAIARRELAELDRFDYALVNDELDAVVTHLREVIGAERSGRAAAARARFAPAALPERVRAGLGL